MAISAKIRVIAGFDKSLIGFDGGGLIDNSGKLIALLVSNLAIGCRYLMA